MLWSINLNFLFSPKAKETYLNYFKWLWIENNNCLFCDDTGTTDHLFFQLVYPEPFWLHDIFFTDNAGDYLVNYLILKP